MEELPKRKNLRLKDYDYNSVGAYFITICTDKRREILSRVGVDVLDDPKNIELLPYGKTVDKYIRQITDFYENMKVDAYIIMPNHIHMILIVSEDGASRTSPPTRQHAAVSRFVSTFKRFCAKEIGHNIFQRGFHDHIIRSREDYEEHARYIYENPSIWHFDELYTEIDNA